MVLATDIAETSLTVEGVRVVVDAGLARRPAFDAGTGLTRLDTVRRVAGVGRPAGRAGRPAGPGRGGAPVVEGRARGRAGAFDEPEIRQADLAGLALELAVWGTEPADLPFLDPPPPRALDEARRAARRTSAPSTATGTPPRPAGRWWRCRCTPDWPACCSPPRDRGQGWLGCLLAALLEDRDVLRGRPDDLPADVGLRLALLADPTHRHPQADGRALRRRPRPGPRPGPARWGSPPAAATRAEAGPLLGVAYPDRIAQARGGPGASCCGPAPRAGWPPTTRWPASRSWRWPRSTAAGATAASAGGAASTPPSSTRSPATRSTSTPGSSGTATATTSWPGSSAGSGGCGWAWSSAAGAGAAPPPRRWSTGCAPPAWPRCPGPTPPGRCRPGSASCARVLGEPWPDVSDAALRRRLDDWLAPGADAAGATGRADLERVDLVRALRAMVPARAGGRSRSPGARGGDGAERAAGCRSTTATAAPGDPPVLAVRVQEMFGSTETPTVAGGRVPVVLHLLSPAGRPVQVTSDLAGFWTGSWREVRKEMAGRYPKHDWPETRPRAVSRRRT